jgi:hypothetical protein
MSFNEKWSATYSRWFHAVAQHSEMFIEKYLKNDYAEAIADITWQVKCRTYEKQKACLHLKGGKYRFTKDYAVTTHTFSDGRQRIKCMLCGLEAWSNSGEDFKFAYMRDLAEYSTNCPSASEHLVLGVKFSDYIVEYYTPAGIAALKAKYPLWDGKFKRAGSDETEDADGSRVEFQEDSIYLKPEDSKDFVQIGEGVSPIKGREPATKLPDEGITLTDKQPDLKGDLQ